MTICRGCGLAASDDLACGDPCCGQCSHPPGPGNPYYQPKDEAPKDDERKKGWWR